MTTETTTLLGEPIAKDSVLPSPLQGGVPWKHDGKKSGLALTLEDVEMFREVEIFQIVGAGQLMALRSRKQFPAEKKAQLFFNELVTKDYRSRGWFRINQLVADGYLRRLAYPRQESVFLLTRHGHGVLVKRKLNKRAKPKDSISNASIHHELTVAKVGLTLKKLWGLDVRLPKPSSRNSLRRPNPDLVAFTPHGRYAIEVELSRKKDERYRLRWPRIYALYECPILYITDFGGGEDRILDNSERAVADYIYVCSLADFKRTLGTAAFKNYNGRKLVLAGVGVPEMPQSLKEAA